MGSVSAFRLMQCRNGFRSKGNPQESSTRYDSNLRSDFGKNSWESKQKRFCSTNVQMDRLRKTANASDRVG